MDQERDGIMAEFLSKNKAEVIRVSIYEYDKELEEKKLRKAEYEAGMVDGVVLGEQKLLERLIQKKLDKGLSIEAIADDLEEEVTTIQKIIEKLKLHYENT